MQRTHETYFGSNCASKKSKVDFGMVLFYKKQWDWTSKNGSYTRRCMLYIFRDPFSMLMVSNGIQREQVQKKHTEKTLHNIPNETFWQTQIRIQDFMFSRKNFGILFKFWFYRTSKDTQKPFLRKTCFSALCIVFRNLYRRHYQVHSKKLFFQILLWLTCLGAWPVLGWFFNLTTRNLVFSNFILLIDILRKPGNLWQTRI